MAQSEAETSRHLGDIGEKRNLGGDSRLLRGIPCRGVVSVAAR